MSRIQVPRPRPKTLKHGHKSLCFMISHYWNMLPNDIKNVESHQSFKYEIKRWQPKCTCGTCVLCKILDL